MRKANYFKISILSISFLFLCLIICGILNSSSSVSTPLHKYCVVIDAGHGGIDCGVVGASGETLEKDINLQLSKKLGALFEAMSVKVIYTRTNDNGLYSPESTNKKVDDMNKRIALIEESNPDLVISLHQNGYTSSDQRGIMAYYKKGQTASENLANVMQSRFKENIEHARQSALEGDYFILNECLSTCVLVECGFLTNPEEEQLLKDEVYQQKICFEIFSGCIQYLVAKGDLCLEK